MISSQPDNNLKNRLPPIAIALLNLTGLSLGYFYMRNFIRGGIHLAITTALILLGIFTPSLHIAPVVVIALLLFFIWMAVDGWRLASRAPALLPIPVVVGLVVALLVLVGEGIGFAAYSSSGQSYFVQGEQAYANSDYAQTYISMQRFTTSYHMSLNANLPAAELRLQECDLLTTAAKDCAEGSYDLALEKYQTYLTTFPNSAKQDEVYKASAQAYYDWAVKLQAAGEYEQAITHYETILSDYATAPVSTQVHQPLGQAHLQWAEKLHSDGKLGDAVAQYEMVIKDFSDTSHLADARNGASQATLEIAHAHITAAEYEQAIAQYQIVLDKYSDLPAAEPVAQEIAQAYLDWGNLFFDQQKYTEALVQYEAILSDYKTTSVASAAADRAGETHLIVGKDLLAAGNFEAAVAEIQIVLDTYSRTKSAAEAKIKAPEAYLGWGKELIGKGETDKALEKLDVVLNLFSNSPSVAEARTVSVSLRLQVARQYRDQGKYEEAVGRYAQLITNYSDFPEAVQAAQEVAEVYLGWARELIEGKRYDEAATALGKITQDYATSTAAVEVPTVTVDLNIAWGQDLVDQKEYIGAIEKLGEVMKTVTDPALLDLITAAYQNAVNELAKDTGSQGKQVTAETIALACDYKRAASPAVGILSGAVRAVVCGGNLSLDSKYAPTNPGNFYYAIFVKEGYTEIERCPYGPTGAYTLIRQQIYLQVTIRSVATNAVYKQQTFTGGYPVECPDRYRFTSQTMYEVGSYPDQNAAVSWITGFLRP